MSLIESFTPRIPANQKYWMVRSNGGTLIEPFLNYGVVSIGHPEISASEVITAKAASRRATTENIKAIISHRDPENTRPGLPASQLHRFAFEMTAGDYVLVPSSGTGEVHLGRLSDSSFFEQTIYHATQQGPKAVENYSKHRNVT